MLFLGLCALYLFGFGSLSYLLYSIPFVRNVINKLLDI